MAGCDAFKAQWCSAAERLCERRNAPGYRAAYRKIAWPAAWHATLARWCAARGLAYSCTVYLPEDVAVVAPHVAAIKVASFEARALDLRAALSRTFHGR